jgi:hypothetical protein
MRHSMSGSQRLPLPHRHLSCFIAQPAIPMQQVLIINLIVSLIVFITAARIYLIPRITAQSLHWVAPPILLANALRHLGLMFLAPGATLPGLPASFAYPAAIGDCVAAALALLALYVLRRSPARAMPWLWLFNIVGTIDFVSAITLANLHGAAPFLSAAYWIPAFWVPLLIASHYVMFVQLIRATQSRSSLAVAV